MRVRTGSSRGDVHGRTASRHSDQLEKPKDKATAKIMVEFLKALTDGQKYCADLGYAPLPPSVVKSETTVLRRVKTS